MARQPFRLVFVGAHYELHLLVGQMIFVTAGTRHGFTARRAADLEEWHGCMVLSGRHILDSDSQHCRALVASGVGPCGSCDFPFGYRE